jgi:hypothetical protein
MAACVACLTLCGDFSGDVEYDVRFSLSEKMGYNNPFEPAHSPLGDQAEKRNPCSAWCRPLLQAAVWSGLGAAL